MNQGRTVFASLGLIKSSYIELREGLLVAIDVNEVRWVVVDVRGLNGGQRFAVDRYIRGLDEAQRSRIILVAPQQ